MLDFHNHLMPAVDDGASDIAESRVGLETLRSQGVTGIITTPHLRASLTERPRDLGNFLGVLDDAWESLQSLAAREFTDIRIERGVELLLDNLHPNLEDPRLRLAGTSFVLVEFPDMAIPPHSTQAIRSLTQNALSPVIAHPERYVNMPENWELLEDWRGAGAYLQVNSGSLLGYYGSAPRRLAWSLIEQGLADYLSSDYHSRGKCAVAECAQVMKTRGGVAQHATLTNTNPRRVLANQRPVPVARLSASSRSFWKRVLPWK